MTTEHRKDPAKDLADFRRLLGTCAAHFAKYGAMGKAAPTTRSLECAFENYQDFSDAMAACLMKKSETSENLRRGLDAWKVFETDCWTESAKRFAGMTVPEIEAATFRPAYATETTPEGAQVLVPGVTPITERDRTQAQAQRPMRGKAAPCNIGLFDTGARNQLDLF